MSPSLFLGLDLSTQQLKAVILSHHLVVIHQFAVNFDIDLPQYGTTNGSVPGPAHGEVTSSVAMWLEAIDLLMQRMKHSGLDLGAIVAISGAGQQHGSVYWSEHAQQSLASLDSEKPLKEQLFPIAFSIEMCPIWQDSSTTEECKLLEAAVGGAQALADLTGSRAYERFTGNQIAKVFTTLAPKSSDDFLADYLPFRSVACSQNDTPQLIAFHWCRHSFRRSSSAKLHPSRPLTQVA
jgi:xylulokinase